MWSGGPVAAPAAPASRVYCESGAAKSKLFDDDVDDGDGWVCEDSGGGGGNFANNGVVVAVNRPAESATDFICSLSEFIFMVAFCFSSSRKLILNQFERRPNFEPPFDIPTCMHLVKRHALHVVRVFLLITHLLFFLHSGMVWDLLHARPKNDCNERENKIYEN